MSYHFDPEGFVHSEVVGKGAEQRDVHRPEVPSGPGNAQTIHHDDVTCACSELLDQALQVRWFPASETPQAPSSSEAVKYIVILFLVISITLAFLIWRFTINDQEFARSKTAKLMERPDMSMDDLKNIKTVDIGEVLKQLGEQADSDSTDKPGKTDPDSDKS